MSSAPDELFTLRNHFYVGNYTQCIHEGGALRLSNPSVKLERDLLVFRSYLACNNPDTVLAETANLNTSSQPALQAVKLQAQLQAFPEKQEDVLQQLKTLLAQPANAADPQVQLVAASVFQSCGDSRAALRTMKAFEGGMEPLAFGVQIYLSMNLVEKAFGLLKKLQSIDDDATLAQLASAWVYLAVGGTKYEEAFFIFQELIDKYGETVPLLNGIAVAAMHQGNYSQASSYLVSALSKKNNDPNTLVNMIVCAQLSFKPQEVIGRYLRELKKNGPQHPWLVRYEAAAASFDRV